MSGKIQSDSTQLEIEITEAEALVKAAGERLEEAKAQAEAVQAEAQKKLKYAEEIKTKKISIIAQIDSGKKQRAKAREFCELLNKKSPDSFKVSLTKHTASEKVVDYHYGDDTKGNETIWEQDFEVPGARIIYTPVPEIYIKVKVKSVYSGWRSRPTDTYWAMYLGYTSLNGSPRYFDYKITDRAYKNPKTVITKIENAVANVAWKKKSVNDRELANKAAEKDMKAQFPECEVEYSKKYSSSSYSSDNYDHYLTITLPNKIVIVFRISTDSETVYKLYRNKVTLPHYEFEVGADHHEVIEKYKNYSL